MNPFDDIIQDKANSHEAPVPAGAWDNIRKKEKKRRYLFFWWMFALLVCGLTIGGYFVFTQRQVGKVEGVGRVGEVSQVNKVKKVNAVDPVVKSGTKDGNTEGNETDEVNRVNEVGSVVVNEEVNPIVDKDDKVEEVDKVEKADVVNNKNLINKKIGTESFKADKNVTANAINSKKKRSVRKNSIAIDITGKAAENNADSWTAKNSKPKKDKGHSAIKITAPETTELLISAEVKGNNIVTGNETVNNEEPQNNLIIEKKVTVEDSSLKKESDPDSVKKKATITKEEENKKSSPVAKKQKTKNPWFIDAAITPILPIQQYDHSTTFNRTLFSNNTQTTFSGKLINTGIDPSLAFSIGLRKKINKKFYIGMGIRYVELKENIHISGLETKTTYNIIDVLDNSGGTPQLTRDTFVTVTQGTRDINAVNSYHFFDIPIFLQYSLIQKRTWALNAVAGVQVNIAARYKNELNRDSITPLISSSPSSTKTAIGFSVYGGIRFAKPIGKKFEFFVLPFINLSLGRQNIKNSLINKKIQQAGLSVGLSYKLN